MFVQDNLNEVQGIADIARDIKADIIFINTPLRPCGVKPLSEGQMKKIKKEFLLQGLNAVSVFDKVQKKTAPIDIAATLRRRGAVK